MSDKVLVDYHASLVHKEDGSFVVTEEATAFGFPVPLPTLDPAAVIAKVHNLIADAAPKK